MVNLEFNEKEVEDIKRGLIICMQRLDETESSGDTMLSNRIELILDKIELQTN